MSNRTRQWILAQCESLNIPPQGTNTHLLTLINNAAAAQRRLTTLKPQVKSPRYGVILRQKVRVIYRGDSFDGLCVRNRADWKFEIMQDGRMLIDFDKKQITRIEYRHDRWLVWIV